MTQTRWLVRSNHYEYPTHYTTQTQAAKAAQRLSNQLHIFAETARRTDDYEDTYFVVITRNDVSHK